ncbi:hypothetical protein ZTR_04186 [Talaromyces verruculosus]|nr:hypothetical protein ZTR_04186 [Talaromyces verruculosus]
MFDPTFLQPTIIRFPFAAPAPTLQTQVEMLDKRQLVQLRTLRALIGGHGAGRAAALTRHSGAASQPQHAHAGSAAADRAPTSSRWHPQRAHSASLLAWARSRPCYYIAVTRPLALACLLACCFWAFWEAAPAPPSALSLCSCLLLRLPLPPAGLRASITAHLNA